MKQQARKNLSLCRKFGELSVVNIASFAFRFEWKWLYIGNCAVSRIERETYSEYFLNLPECESNSSELKWDLESEIVIYLPYTESDITARIPK